MEPQTLSGNLTLVDGDKAIQKIDCNGANRDVTLPAVATTNHVFYIVNSSGGAFTITVKNAGGSTIATVAQGAAGIILSTGAVWYSAGGGTAPTTTAANDFQVGSGAGTWIKKTLAETLTILGKAVASGLASLDGSSLVVQNPANATATPTASKIPISLANGYLDGWISGIPQGMRNGKIVVTNPSNDLVVSIKTLAGADPSATDPVKIMINGTERTITAALSVTIPDGANSMNLGASETATIEQDLFVYLIWNTGPATDIVDIGISRYPAGYVYSNFSGTSTNEKYLAYGNATQPNATDDVTPVGRIAATLSAGAGYTWTSASASAPTGENTIQYPIRYSRVLTYVPTFVGFSAGPAYVVRIFYIDSRILFKVSISNTASNGTSFTLTAPVTSKTVASMFWNWALSNAVDNSVGVAPGDVYIGSASNIITLRKSALGAWTAAGNKGGAFTFEFEW